MEAYQQLVNRALRQAENNPAFLASTVDAQVLTPLTCRAVLDELIQNYFIKLGARQMNITVSTASIQERINLMKQGYPTEKDFLADLVAEGTSVKDLTVGIRDQLLITEITQQLLARISVSNADIERFFSQHPDMIENRDKKQVSQIVVDSRKFAEEIIARIKGGEAFGQLAMDLSIDAETNASGGDLGYLDIKTFPAPIYKKIRGLKSGDTSKPIEMDGEFYIIKIGETLAMTPDKREAVRDYLLKAKQQNIFEKWLDDQKAKGNIVFHPSLQKYYHAPSSAVEAPGEKTGD